jgi:hypothetical protein
MKILSYKTTSVSSHHVLIDTILMKLNGNVNHVTPLVLLVTVVPTTVVPIVTMKPPEELYSTDIVTSHVHLLIMPLKDSVKNVLLTVALVPMKPIIV